jgi:hypothetical protein
VCGIQAHAIARQWLECLVYRHILLLGSGWSVCYTGTGYCYVVVGVCGIQAHAIARQWLECLVYRHMLLLGSGEGV